MNKIAICIPSGDMVHADFAMSLAALCYMAGPHGSGDDAQEAIPIALCNTKGSLVVNNRNRLVAEAQQLGVDYLLFVDSDIVLPPWALRRLLSHDKDIVGAIYRQREAPFRMLGKSVEGQMMDEHMAGRVLNPAELMEVGALPGGCLLVKASVFDKLVKPYFQTPAHAADGDKPEWIEGEDYFFGRMAREAGFQLWLDWTLSLSLNHIGQHYNTIAVQNKPEANDALVH